MARALLSLLKRLVRLDWAGLTGWKNISGPISMAATLLVIRRNVMVIDLFGLDRDEVPR